MDKNEFDIFFIAVWTFGILLTLAFWGVVAWAVIQLVQHITG